VPVYYTLAHTGGRQWPYTVDLCFDAVPCPVGLAEGVGQGVGAITVSAGDALSETWKEHFVHARALWLIPYLEDLAAGVPLPRAEIWARYEELHGQSPQVSELWP
jgi:hypothetical protein